MKFVHGPGLGDIIYSFPVIKHLGGGDLILLPYGDFYQKHLVSLSFFERQPYIHSARIAYKPPDQDDPDLFLTGDFWAHPKILEENLVKTHFETAGFKAPESIEPWLVARTYTTNRVRVLLHHTSRYNSERVDYSFLNRVSHGDLFCIGYAEEVMPIVHTYGAFWINTPTMDEMAAVINSCDVFVGNQSSPLAIAAGLGKNRLVERSSRMNNCDMGHPNEHSLTANPMENWRLLRRYYTPRAIGV